MSLISNKLSITFIWYLIYNLFLSTIIIVGALCTVFKNSETTHLNFDLNVLTFSWNTSASQ